MHIDILLCPLNLTMIVFVPLPPPPQTTADGNLTRYISNTELTDHHGSHPVAALASEITTDQSTATLYRSSYRQMTRLQPVLIVQLGPR